MLKFFRKYNKIILVFGGSLLMVVFIAPQLVQEFGGQNPGQRVVGTYSQGKVTEREMMVSGRQLEVARQFFSNAQSRVLNVGTSLEPVIIQSQMHWYLLAKEAEQAGLLGDVKDAENTLNAIILDERARAFQLGRTPDDVEAELRLRFETGRSRLLANGQYTNEFIDESIARFRSISRLVRSVRGEALGTGIMLSDRELQQIGQDVFQQAEISLALFDANSPEFVSLNQPSRDSTEATFNRFRSVDLNAEPSEDNESQFGISYVLPTAFDVEWVKITRNFIIDGIETDPLELRKFYLQRQQNYMGDFLANEQQVRSDFREQEVTRLLDLGIRAIRRELTRATRSLGVDGQYRVLPDDWASQRPSMADLAAAANNAILDELPSIQLIPVETGSSNGLRDANELLALPGIGRTVFRLGAQVLNFAQLCEQVRELNPQFDLGLQTGLTFGPIREFNNNAYFFRITQLREAGPADTLEQVQGRVILDSRNMQAYEQLTSQQRLAQIEQTLTAEGIEALRPDATTVVSGVIVTPTGFLGSTGTTIPPNVRAVGTQEFRDEILSLVDTWDPYVPAGDLPISERTLVIPVPSEQAVVAVVITNQYPATTDRVRNAEGTVTNAARVRLYDEAQTAHPMSMEAVFERFDFVPTSRNEDDELLDDPESETAPAPGTPA